MFKEVGMAAYLGVLTSASLIKFFLANVDEKGERLLNVFKSIDAHQHKQVLDALLKVQTERSHSTGCTEEVLRSYRWCFFYWLILMRRKRVCSIMLRRQALLRRFKCGIYHLHPALLYVVSKLNQTCMLSPPH